MKQMVGFNYVFVAYWFEATRYPIERTKVEDYFSDVLLAQLTHGKNIVYLQST